MTTPLTREQTKSVYFLNCDDWSAVYVDGDLVHWHDTPNAEQMLDILGVTYESEWFSECLKKEMYEGGRNWSPPKTLDALNELELDLAAKQLQATVDAAQVALDAAKAKLKSVRGDV